MVVVILGIALAWIAGRDHATATTEDDPGEAKSLVSRAGSSDSGASTKLNLRVAPKAAVRGSVRDPDGNPIANAQVCAVSSEAARRGVPNHALHCVRTDAKGQYAIDGLLPIATAVHASAATFRPTRWELRERGATRSTVPLRAGQTTANIDLVLLPGGVLVRGVVKDIAGGEIEGAQVTLSGGWRTGAFGAAIVVSGADGRFEQWAAPGELILVGRIEGYADGWVSGVAPSEQIRAVPDPRSIIVGTVVAANTGEGVEGVEVTAGGFGSGGSAISGADGVFRLDRLQPGSYDIHARSEELYGEAAGQVHVGLGETSEPILVPMHPAVWVEGEVRVVGGTQADRMCPEGRVVLRSREAGDVRSDIDRRGSRRVSRGPGRDLRGLGRVHESPRGRGHPRPGRGRREPARASLGGPRRPGDPR